MVQELNHVTRYVVTYVNGAGMRTLVSAAQGRNTFASDEAARAHMAAMLTNNHPSTLAQIFGEKGAETFEVRPCACWAGHFDPVGVWFDD